MKSQLLVDSGKFWAFLKKDIQESRNYVYIQTLSFEGDEVGNRISDELLSSISGDKRVLVDNYTKYVISDRFMYRPKNFLNPDLRSEKAQTFKMIDELNNSGVQVKFTNPVGLLLAKFPARNHKKMILVDENISYIGGINFSDHNFDWHDSMLRIDDPEINKFLRQDFLSTWEGNHIYAEKAFDKIKIYLYDGSSNEEKFQVIFEKIKEAKESIFIESPYISFPFYKKLREAHNRGVKITMIAPDKHNRKNIRRYTLWETKRSGIDLWLYQSRMTHVKAMLIDDSTLIFGSTNFDYVSYRAEQELVAIATDRNIINDFKKRIFEADLKNSKEFKGDVNHKRGFLHYLGLQIVGKTLVFLSKL